MLGFREGRDATVVLHVARARIVGRKSVDDVAIEHVQHLRQVPRAPCDLQIRVVIVGRVDAEIARRGGHDLREPESSHGGARTNLEPAFLPDQRLQKAAPLHKRQARAAYAW